MERIKNGLMMGEEILGGYEVRGGRPAEISVVDSEVAIKMGTPRPGANPLPPEKMLRQAAAAACRSIFSGGIGLAPGRGVPILIATSLSTTLISAGRPPRISYPPRISSPIMRPFLTRSTNASRVAAPSSET